MAGCLRSSGVARLRRLRSAAARISAGDDSRYDIRDDVLPAGHGVRDCSRRYRDALRPYATSRFGPEEMSVGRKRGTISLGHLLDTLGVLVSSAVGTSVTGRPRTDPGGRDSRTGLPPWVLDGDRYSFIAADSHRLLLAGLPAHKLLIYWRPPRGFEPLYRRESIVAGTPLKQALRPCSCMPYSLTIQFSP